MNKYKLGAMVAAGLLAGGMSAGSASAADLGGNCCADLEERIAELEATTVRKGNRKVSLTISGFVAQQVMYWDDGIEDNVYITDTGSVSIGTHVRFAGQATIAPGWTAGYVLKLETIQNNSLLVDQDNDNGIAGNAMALVANGNHGSSSAVAVESSYWFVKSDHLGKLSVGKQSSAADNQAIIVDGSGSLVQANYVLYDVNAFFIRREGGGTFASRWGGVADCVPLNGSGGVSATATATRTTTCATTRRCSQASRRRPHGEKTTSGPCRLAMPANSAVSSSPLRSPTTSLMTRTAPAFLLSGDGFDAAALQIGAYVQHVPTGLFVYGAYAQEYIDQ